MLYNSIRNKRDANYEVLESDGLRSHFRPNNVNAFKTIFAERLHHDGGEQSLHRQVRSTETDAPKKPEKTIDGTKKEQNKTNEDVPTALRRVMKSGGFFPDTKSASASALVSKWTRTPFEYSKIQHEEDSMAMDSSQSSHSVNEGIKARTPRVNFVTQQKKSLDQNNNNNNNEDSKSSATKPEFYKSPPLIHDTKDSTQPSYSDRSSERTPARPSTYPDYYRERDPDKYYMNQYDKYVNANFIVIDFTSPMAQLNLPAVATLMMACTVCLLHHHRCLHMHTIRCQNIVATTIHMILICRECPTILSNTTTIRTVVTMCPTIVTIRQCMATMVSGRRLRDSTTSFDSNISVLPCS